MVEFGAGVPAINFAAHQARTNGLGAAEDFEQMLALLVQAVTGEKTSLIFTNPGDWGIDVLVGDLNGHATIWQAKYFARGVGKSQQKQIRDSFASAVKSAKDHGYTVERWILCIPSSMDAPTTRWWSDWKARETAATKVQIELWDEAELRRLLLLPDATHVRRAYYDPYRGRDADDSPPVAPPATPAERARWEGGDEVEFGKVSYLLYDEPVEITSQDRAWRWREATAEAIDRGRDRVRLRQAHRLRRSDAADRRLAALRTQAALLTEMGGAHGLPRLRELHDDPDTVTLISSHPAGPTWREVFGPAGSPLDRLTAAALLDATQSLCAGLHELHRRGHAHRSLSSDNIIMTQRSRKAVPLDIGLAAIELAAGEGVTGWRAPEQTRLGQVGPRTDAWQVAALLYHTLTGHPPSPHGSPPIRASIPEFPVELDELILRNLDIAPERRVGDLRRLGAALREGRAMLSRGGG